MCDFCAVAISPIRVAVPHKKKKKQEDDTTESYAACKDRAFLNIVGLVRIGLVVDRVRIRAGDLAKRETSAEVSVLRSYIKGVTKL